MSGKSDKAKGPLAGKVAVVTGGGGILCGEMARALGADGAKVAILGAYCPYCGEPRDL